MIKPNSGSESLMFFSLVICQLAVNQAIAFVPPQSSLDVELIYAINAGISEPSFDLKAGQPSSFGSGGGSHDFSFRDLTSVFVFRDPAVIRWSKRAGNLAGKPDAMKTLPSLLQPARLPEFDDDQDEWKAQYRYHADGRWFGIFAGARLKPFGALPPPFSHSMREDFRNRVALDSDEMELKKARSEVIDLHRKIQFQLETWNGEKVPLSYNSGLALMHSDSETDLLTWLMFSKSIQVSSVDSPGMFKPIGIIAQIPKGSAFRPESDSRIRIRLKIDGQTDKIDEQFIELPQFDPELPNWYCYLTLDSKNVWTAKFEGMVK